MDMWDILQHYQISEARRMAIDAQRNSERASGKIEDRLDTLVLANAAMWSILRDHLGITDEQLLTRMKELDALDGVFDGKLGSRRGTCSGCGRTVTARKGQCMYCGETLGGEAPFDKAV
jgi:hypothetical protein